MAHISAVFLLLLQLSLHDVARARQNEPKIIPPGSKLSPGTKNSTWASSSGHFEFGFYPEGNGFALGIWIVGDQSQNTVVWTANRDDPPLNSSNATLELTRQGDLVLRDEDGNYRRNFISDYLTDSADSASMLDSGNFVLYGNGSIIWQSFHFPTDTILGGQNLSAGNVNQTLISSVSISNHSTGLYRLWFETDGDNILVATPNFAEADSSDAYWTMKGLGKSFEELNLNEEGRLILYGRESGVPDQIQQFLANSSRIGDKEDLIYRATLDPDGIFRIYSHQFKSNFRSNWTKTWQNLDDVCAVYGYCGLNSYCSSRGAHLECYCYPGFTFINDNMKSLGCSQNFTIDACEERKDQVMQYNITILDNVTWNGVLYYFMPDTEVEDCKKACEQNCNCGGALYSDGNCTIYSLPLRHGRRGNISTIAFIKVILGSNATSPRSGSGSSSVVDEASKRLLSTMGISLGSVTFFCFLIAISSFLVYRHRNHSYRKLLENKSSGLTEQFTLQSFTFSELDRATDGFKEELGKGSFGAVYRGILPGDKDNRTIAVKRLDKVNEGERQFRTEMAVIGRTNHRNLVRLLGFCAEGSKKLLVYEYLSNGSLANFLFNTSKERPIWKDRARIALDVAKGMRYLHEECEVCIIHCNIKPQNILLDDFMTAKISDFGLAKLWMPNQITSITGIRGTTRYSAPECQRNASFSVKVDVYSFGVILLEIICCRSSMEVTVSSADEILLSTWVYNCFVAGELNKLVEGEEVDLKMLERFVKVGLWCIQDDPDLRPLMKNVTLMLEGTVKVPVPPLPSFSHVTNYK